MKYLEQNARQACLVLTQGRN